MIGLDGIVAIFIRRVAALSSPPSPDTDFAPIRFIAIASVFMRFGAERAEGHARRDEALAHFGDRLDLVDRHRLGRAVNSIRSRR